MNKFYILICVFGLVFLSYLNGIQLGKAKCQQQNAKQIIQTTNNQMIKRNKINAQVYNTGTADIRNILCEKYTIAD